MRAFYREYRIHKKSIRPPAVAKLSWTHNVNFYFSAVDDLLRGTDDKPTMGLLLCRDKRHFDVEYALRDINKPIGVASWETQVVSKLPKHLKSSLPTVEEIEAELKDAPSAVKTKRVPRG